ncbi:hypothetical protein LTR08_001275 [Meristemomyces frigidus]|nr:hypothetical protein LTR08_001275 [Meristemomyces frigidus]
MHTHDSSPDSGSEHRQHSMKVPEAVITDTKLFSKSEARVTFDSASLDSLQPPIDSYEGRHRYDPEFEWTPAEEKKLVRKIDYKICAFVCFMFFALQLDRGNISQALSDNMLDDLGLTTNDYNMGQTIFYLTFLCAELPSQLISKKIGPDNWIPIQMVSWSLVASMQAFLSGRGSFWACRALLGLIEGGFIPDNILYLSYWYTGAELPIRLSFFWVAYQTTSIVSAFMAFGILHMRGINGLAGWRWLFALEGLLTGLIGIVSYFYLPPSPTQTASKLRGKDGWFSEREEKIMVNRVLRDDPSKGDMHNRQGLSPKMFWQCLCDFHMWPIYLLGLTWALPSTPVAAYLTLNLKAAGFGTFETNLLTIPAYVLFIVNLLFWTWVSEKLNDRFLVATVSQVWALPLLIALECLPATRNSWASGIISSNVYRTSDKPLYRRGNKALIAIACYNLVLFVGAKYFYVTVNRKREIVWSAMSKEEKQHYLTTTTDQGNKRLDFRFAH